MKTFVINLKRRPERLETFMNNVGRHLNGFDIEIIEAVDGRDYDPETERKNINSWNFKYLNEKKRKAVIACCKSHLIALEKLIDSNVEHGLIFEDDAHPVVPGENLLHEINSVELPENFGFIYLNRFKELVNNPITQSVNIAVKGETAESYIISREFAKYAHGVISKNMGAFDRQLELFILMDRELHANFEFYVTNRQIFHQKNRRDTDIQF
jgi:GR25 family glycosyltransferase involved in LPS biosynthesis